VTGRVYLIGAGPGDPGLLTLKAKACLEVCSVVLYDHLVSAAVLQLIPLSVELINVGKHRANHPVPQADIERLLVQKALGGHVVGRLKGGDPFVFGRGAEEAETLVHNGIPFEVIPGITSAIAAPAYAGIALTHRDLASGFHVVTGHECITSTGTPWSLLALSSQTLVILMGMGHLREIAARLVAAGRCAKTPVAVICSGTTDVQRVIVSTLAMIAQDVEAAGCESPGVIVIGEVVRLRESLAWFESEVPVQISGQTSGLTG